MQKVTKMKEFEGKTFSGERAQYFAQNESYKNCTFSGGESHLKHSQNIESLNSSFEYKYPFWNTKNTKVKNSIFHELAKSGLWYTKNFFLEDSKIEAPKEFRRSKGIFCRNVDFLNAAETMWSCRNIHLENVKVFNGDYFAMNSSNFFAQNLELNGNYFLDGGSNIEIHNSKITSKDAFWNCKNVKVYDSIISGEYLAWNSKNVKFINCQIESDQGLCYVDGLTLENCTLKNTVLAFEYSKKINAKINGFVESIKNPKSGKISADKIGTLILNPSRCKVKATKINCPKIQKFYSKDPNENENLYSGTAFSIPEIK